MELLCRSLRQRRSAAHGRSAEHIDFRPWTARLSEGGSGVSLEENGPADQRRRRQAAKLPDRRRQREWPRRYCLIHPQSSGKNSLMLAIDQQSLQLDVDIAVEADFDFLSAEYRSLHNLRRATVCQAPLWLDAIHRKLVPQLSATQYTVTIRNRHDKALLAVIPLVVQKSSGLCILQPADFGVCDYNCIVADPMVLETLARDPSVLDRIDALLGVAGVFIFRKVRDDGFDASRLFKKTTATACENAAYHSEIGNDFEAWQRRTISRKFSKELGR